jgi:hypothetical protein
VQWAAWLAAPVVATLVAALWAWWRARLERTPGPDKTMQAHRDYLDALTIPARGTMRTDQR